jgi:hypothetical protein
VFITELGNIALADPTSALTKSVTTDAFVDQSTQALRIYQFPTFSNDGKWLAFVSIAGSAQAGSLTQTLHVATAAENATLTDLYATSSNNIPYLDWSPDDAAVAFLTIGQGAGQIRITPKAGGKIAVLDSGSSVYWHWRNDSMAMVAHLSGNGADAHLSLIDDINTTASSGNLKRLASLPGRFQSPAFAPNGQHMLYVVSINRDTNDLVLADASGQPICMVTRMETGAFFAWSPNGKQIAFLDTVSPMQLPTALNIVELESGKRLQIERNAVMFFWSPDGSKLALYSIVSDAELTQLAHSSTSKTSAPTRQGARALRIEIIDAANGKALRVADTLPTRDLAQFFQFFDQYSRAVTPWSPNSQQLVFVTVDTNQDLAKIGVGTLNATGSAVSLKPITEGKLAFWSPR